MILLIVDGVDTMSGGDWLPIDESGEIRATGTRIVGVGISSVVVPDTVKSIASKPTDAFYFNHATYAEAEAAVTTLKAFWCNLSRSAR